jgi:hypothetical protein
MHISTNDLHYCKPERQLQRAQSGGLLPSSPNKNLVGVNSSILECE